MKERPTKIYWVEVSRLARQEGYPWPGMPDCWRLVANQSTEVLFLSRIPSAPWPPPEPRSYDALGDIDEEIRTVVMWSPLIVSPTDGNEEMESVVDANWDWRTFFWVGRRRYARLGEELEQILAINGGVRVETLRSESELRHLLMHQLPRARGLADYDRKMLCLPSIEEMGLASPRVP